MHSKKLVQGGDNFATPLPLNKYGAANVMNVIDCSYLLSITGYIDEKLPIMDDQNVYQILITKSLLNKKDERTFLWGGGRVSKDIVYISNTPLAQDEIGIESNVSWENWSEECLLQMAGRKILRDLNLKWKEK